LRHCGAHFSKPRDSDIHGQAPQFPAPWPDDVESESTKRSGGIGFRTIARSEATKQSSFWLRFWIASLAMMHCINAHFSF
jgi:hypothetical protein